MKHSTYFYRLFGLAFCLASSQAYAAELYRWADENGKIHYTDRVPAEYVEHGYRVISEQGLTIQTIKPVAEEIEEMAEEAAPPELSAEQQARDRRLLMSYSSEEDILDTRDRKIDELEALILFNKKNINALESQYRELTRQAGDYEKQGKEIPDALLLKLNATNQKISALSQTNLQRSAEVTRTAAQFDKDFKRYQVLKAGGEIGAETELDQMRQQHSNIEPAQQISQLEHEIAEQDHLILKLETRFKKLFGESLSYRSHGQAEPQGLRQELDQLKQQIQKNYVENLQSQLRLKKLRAAMQDTDTLPE